MIYLKKNVGFWQFGDRLFLDVYVRLSFASVVDVHIYIWKGLYISVTNIVILCSWATESCNKKSV